MKKLLFLLLFCLMPTAITAMTTPLHEAVKKNNDALVEELIAGGADVNARDSQGKTPLMVLYKQDVHDGESYNRDSSLHIAKLLVEHGADVNARSSEGNTVLHYLIKPYSTTAHYLPFYLQSIEYLIEHGARCQRYDL